MEFYEIRTVWIKNAVELFRAVYADNVVDYQMCNREVNGKFKVYLVVKI